LRHGVASLSLIGGVLAGALWAIAKKCNLSTVWSPSRQLASQ
jgi:hypothetical protein